MLNNQAYLGRTGLLDWPLGFQEQEPLNRQFVRIQGQSQVLTSSSSPWQAANLRVSEEQRGPLLGNLQCFGNQAVVHHHQQLIQEQDIRQPEQHQRFQSIAVDRQVQWEQNQAVVGHRQFFLDLTRT